MFLAFTSPNDQAKEQAKEQAGHADQAKQDVSWLAIRQPAVIRLLEQELGSPDDARVADAFAAGLELACRVLGGKTPLGDLRLDHQSLATGMAAVRAGRCDRAMVRSISSYWPSPSWWNTIFPLWSTPVIAKVSA